MNYGIPKRDGTGRGIRANLNRGGCCAPGLGAVRMPTSGMTASSFMSPMDDTDSGFKWWHGALLGVAAITAIVIARKV